MDTKAKGWGLGSKVNVQRTLIVATVELRVSPKRGCFFFQGVNPFLRVRPNTSYADRTKLFFKGISVDDTKK